MTMPFYVAPEQLMKDKADFARKNIARGRPLVATVYDEGVLICSENPSRSLHKVSEIYDRIAFAGVGKYNEFDQLRVAGVQHADIKGYQFSREDVDARSLANLYARYMGNVFTHEMKPLEVEILVTEVGARPGADQIFHILYDGTVVDEDRFTALGGEAEAISGLMARAYRPDWGLSEALAASVRALGVNERHLSPHELEVAVLERANGRRAFRRVLEAEVASLLAGESKGREVREGHEGQERRTPGAASPHVPGDAGGEDGGTVPGN
jgi:proteasome alpha subunit